mmetsp:Transcript_40562/g.67803  ORF Transcript_40562/g.67803 Transcript_40562/m.67803 type:complete len:152 (+) Transcript_40562:126-581(+)
MAESGEDPSDIDSQDMPPVWEKALIERGGDSLTGVASADDASVVSVTKVGCTAAGDSQESVGPKSDREHDMSPHLLAGTPPSTARGGQPSMGALSSGSAWGVSQEPSLEGAHEQDMSAHLRGGLVSVGAPAGTSTSSMRGVSGQSCRSLLV